MSLPPLPLPAGIRSRVVYNIRDLDFHILEGGDATNKLILLLHGFPELAYSWRKIIPGLSGKYHVVAPDLRGYGRTGGCDSFGDPEKWRMTNQVADVVGIVLALGHTKVKCLIGHDFGSPLAAHCALIRPDMFPAVCLMSAPFAGPPSLPFNTHLDPPPHARSEPSDPQWISDLANLPRPRKHYHWAYSTPTADSEMTHPPQGLHAFLRAYYHHKSGDFSGNNPFPLKGWTAEELAKLPTYYVMERDKTMPESCVMPTPDEIARAGWLTDDELSVYVSEYSRTGFQGGLNNYRIRTSHLGTDLLLFSNKPFEAQLLFIAGDKDWGMHQSPGVFEAMEKLPTYRGGRWVKGAGHWVQQERPEEVLTILEEYIGSL